MPSVAIDRSVMWRAAGVQTLAVAGLSVGLSRVLPHSFFEDYGWAAGPGAWVVCSLATARALRLPVGRTLAGAALAGVPSAIAVVAGVHWLGAAVAVGAFATWCGATAGRDGGRLDEPAVAAQP
jgi:hypothetical protein